MTGRNTLNATTPPLRNPDQKKDGKRAISFRPGRVPPPFIFFPIRLPRWYIVLFLAMLICISECGVATSLEMETPGDVALNSDIPAASTIPEGKFSFTLRGMHGAFDPPLDESQASFFLNHPPSFDGDVSRYYRAYIENPEQDQLLSVLVNAIENSGYDDDDQARLAISLVQNLNYTRSGSHVKYPYLTVLEGGDCDDKATLLAYLLKKLGYGTALLYFVEEKHMAVGIRCADSYDYRDTGYCFVEASHPSIPTDSYGKYKQVGELTSIPEIITVAEGNAFDTIDEEFQDAIEWNTIRGSIEEESYAAETVEMRSMLATKYGIIG
jgi:hypothetical protein